MKTITTLYLGILLTLMGRPLTHAQEPRTDINPALLYYQSFLLAPDLPKEDRHYLFESQDWLRGERLPDRFGELVSFYGKQLRYAKQAARCTVPCDWGIDLSPGPNTLLPHLAKCKGIAQAGRLHAMWALQQGQQAEARDNLLACLALGRNTSRDGTLIAALVQLAIENIVCSAIAENFFQLTPETLQQLSQGFATAPARGTIANCILGEKQFFQQWFLQKARQAKKDHSGDESKIIANMQECIAWMEPSDEGSTQPAEPTLWERTLQASGGTSDGILKLIQDMGPLYDRLHAIMSLPPAEHAVQIKAFYAELLKSNNPLAISSLIPLETSREKELVGLGLLAMVQAAIEYKLHGADGFKSVADPYGKGPFAFERFTFEGVDRGFRLQSAYQGKRGPIVMIFVDKDGPAFKVNGPKVGQSIKEPGK